MCLLVEGKNESVDNLRIDVQVGGGLQKGLVDHGSKDWW